MATLSVLKRAKAQGINLIITREPAFYNHLDSKEEFDKDDPVPKVKTTFIEENKLIVFHFHDTPHMVKEDITNPGLIQELGWEKYHQGDMIFKSPYETIEGLSQFLKEKFNTTTVRVVGDPEIKLGKVEILPGAYGREQQIDQFNNSGTDALTVGEAREWETIEDARESGIKKALIVLGHAGSEEGGMELLVDHLQKLFPKIPVAFLEAGNPLWPPE